MLKKKRTAKIKAKEGRKGEKEKTQMKPIEK